MTKLLNKTLETADSATQTIEITAIADNRRNSRVGEYILAEAFTDNGNKELGMIVDLSFYGLRLEGGRQMVDKLFSHSDSISSKLSTPIRVNFTIPKSSTDTISTTILCKPVFIKKIDNAIYQIGMEFIEIEKGTTELVDHLLARGLS